MRPLMIKLTAHGFGALPDFSLCQNLLGSEIYSFVWSPHLWLLHCKRMQRILSFSTPWHWTYTQSTTGHNWMKPVSVAVCAHAFMMIWLLIKDLKDDRVHAGIGGNFCHSHHRPVTLKCVTKVFEIIFSTAWHLAISGETLRSTIRTFQQPKSKIRAQKLDKTAIRCGHRIRRSVKISLWIQDPG